MLFNVSIRIEAELSEKHASAQLLDAWVQFLGRWHWDWFCTFTFRDAVHPESADKKYRVWLSALNESLYGKAWRKHGAGVRWVRALEWQKRDVLHYHALIGGTRLDGTRRLTWMDRWLEMIGGFATIHPATPGAAAAYCSKYVVKGGSIDVGGPLAGEEIAAWLKRWGEGIS